MGIEGLAAVESRIAAIESRIAALDGGGRPPIALTESSAVKKTPEPTPKTEETKPFSEELQRQIAKPKPVTSVPTTGSGQIQGVPGTAEAFVEKLKSHLGVPYVWGGTDPKRGLDCSGLVQLAAREVGVNLPRVVWDQKNAGKPVDSIANAKPGDLLITRNGAHVAVFIGNGQAIHAPRPGKFVEITSVSHLGPIMTIRRIMPSADAAPQATPAVSANSPTPAAPANTAGPAANSTPTDPSKPANPIPANSLTGNTALNPAANLSTVLGTTGLGNLATLSSSAGLNGAGAAAVLAGLAGANKDGKTSLDATQVARLAAAQTQFSGLTALSSQTSAQAFAGRAALGV